MVDLMSQQPSPGQRLINRFGNALKVRLDPAFEIAAADFCLDEETRALKAEFCMGLARKGALQLCSAAIFSSSMDRIAAINLCPWKRRWRGTGR